MFKGCTNLVGAIACDGTNNIEKTNTNYVTGYFKTYYKVNGTQTDLCGSGEYNSDVNGYGKGDIVVNISIYIPETLNSQDRKAMEQLAQSDHIRPDQKVKESIFRKFRNYFSRQPH